MKAGQVPVLRLRGLIEMNVGFFGLQFSFGLQQANMAPLYATLGADPGTMPLLWLAGPVTGLVVQPLVGAISDRTSTRLGRRTPFFLLGAIICSLSLFAMPHSTSLWMAASLLWILDAGNNLTMEPYRAFVADRLGPAQQSAGFLIQSAFTGLAQTSSYLAPSLLTAVVAPDLLDANGVPVVVRIAFVVGAILSLATMLYSILRVPELPVARAAAPAGLPSLRATFGEIAAAVRAMPRPMRQLAPAMFCQWFAMFAYWQYIAFVVAETQFGTKRADSAAFRAATLATQQAGAFYNAVAFAAALALIPIVRRFGARDVHCACLAASGAAMLLIPHATGQAALFAAMIGIGIGWAGMMGNSYVMLAAAIPPDRNGVYMGIFNLFIVVPMLVESLAMPLLFAGPLGGDPRHVLSFAGGLMLLGALATARIRSGAGRHG